MNLDAFRKIIREEVKKAIQEEMREVLLEAVKSSSTSNPLKSSDPTLIQPYVEIKSQTKPQFNEVVSSKITPIIPTGNPLLDILNETSQEGEWKTLNGNGYSATDAVSWNGGMPGLSGHTPVVSNVDEMISRNRHAKDISQVNIDVVPDFSKFMRNMKENGNI